MKKIFYLLILLWFLSCNKDEQKPKSLACFDFSADTLLKVGDVIFFSNCTENSTSFFWDFGDGTYSTSEIPLHVYEEAGRYTVKLVARNDYYLDSISKSISIGEIYIGVSGGLDGNEIGNITYDFDIDKDSIADMSIHCFYQHNYFVYNPSLYYIEFSMMNGYEINVSDFIEPTCWTNDGRTEHYYNDTILIPKIHNIHDTAKINDVYLNSQIMLIYAKSSGYVCNIDRDIWISSDYRYIVFRKKSENENILAWLKVKVTGYSKIYLNSYKCFKNQDEVIIE